MTSPFLDLPFPDVERLVLDAWDRERVFERSVEERPAEALWTLFDGPPFATGTPHYGHAAPHALKDALPRYQTMRGRRVPRVFGWDCHGVPVEMEVQKALGIDAHAFVRQHGVAAFNERCRAIVMRCEAEWRVAERRLGRFVDMDHAYRTMDTPYMESVWWVFQTLWKKGLLYEGRRVSPYSPALGTAMSNFEAALNYKDLESPAVTVTFPLLDDDRVLLAWTTTPWSLPGNVAVAVNRSLAYVEVRKGGRRFVVAATAAARLFGTAGTPIEVERLLGARYAPVLPATRQHDARCFRVVHGDHVTDTEGTGIVHIAPAHGEEDFAIGQREGLPVVDVFDAACAFSDTAFAGLGFRDAVPAVLQALGDRLFARETITHSYPCCWRTDVPLMYRAVPSWYVAVTRLKDRLLAHNDAVRWVPEHVGQGRFRNWLENVRDWSISRDRWWGTPIPVWRAEGAEDLVVGSVAELAELTGARVDDLHRENVDPLVIRRDGREYRRVTPVLDCWFESGAMPYGQAHHPFSAGMQLPADVVCEGIDQTRGWFYTLHVLSTALFDRPAFRSVVVNGIVLAEDGRKMSKRLKNYPPLEEIFDRHGADALRLYLLGSSVVRGGDLCLAEKDISGVVRDVLLPLRNVARFWRTWADASDFVSAGPPVADHPLDRWLLARAEAYRAESERAFEALDTVAVAQALREWVEDLSKTYVRLSRRRFGRQAMPTARTAALSVLHAALRVTCLCLAPMAPFQADAIWRVLGGVGSVHLAPWPTPGSADPAVLDDVLLLGRVTTLGHRLRQEASVPVRQPLSRIILDAGTADRLRAYREILAEELNVDHVERAERVEHHLSPRVRLDFSKLGRRLGARLATVQAAVRAGDFRVEGDVLLAGAERLATEEFTLEWAGDERLRYGRTGDLAVVLDVRVDESLAARGAVRELVRIVQDLRKEAGCAVDEEVEVGLSTSLAGVLAGSASSFALDVGARLVEGPAEGTPWVRTARISGIEGTLSLRRMQP